VAVVDGIAGSVGMLVNLRGDVTQELYTVITTWLSAPYIRPFRA